MHRLFLWAALLSGALATSAASGADFEVIERTNISAKIGDVSGFPRSVRVDDVSSDGAVAIGRFSRGKSDPGWRVFRYTAPGHLEDLGPLAPNIQELCVSPDGKVIWGSSMPANGEPRLFRYMAQRLDYLDVHGRKSVAPNAVSGDGSVVVGRFWHSTTSERKPIYHAFSFSVGRGFEDLGNMGAESAFARGISADGSWIVGNFHLSKGSDHAFRYSRAGGIESIGPIGGRAAFATGISKNGIVVGTFVVSAGLLEHAFDSHVFLFTKSSGVRRLGAMGGKTAGKARISPDGTRFAGSYKTSTDDSFVYVALVR